MLNNEITPVIKDQLSLIVQASAVRCYLGPVKKVALVNSSRAGLDLLRRSGQLRRQGVRRIRQARRAVRRCGRHRHRQVWQPGHRRRQKPQTPGSIPLQ